MRGLGSRAGVLFAIALAWGCTKQPFEFNGEIVTADTSQVIAQVGEAPVTVEALRLELRRTGAHDPARFDELHEKQATLGNLLRVEILAQSALAANLDADPEIAYEYKLLLAQRFWASHMRALEQIEISEAQMQTFYQSNLDEFTRPARNRGAIVFLRARADASPQARVELRQQGAQFIADLQSGRTSFEALARKRSDHAYSRERGGDIGWISPEATTYHLERPVLAALAAIESPQAAPQLVETERGVYLVRLMDRDGGEVAPFEDVRKQLASTLRARILEERAAAEYEKLRREHVVKVDTEALEQLEIQLYDSPFNGPPSFPVAQATNAGTTPGTTQ